MDDLMQWLGEQLDEDERIARAADSSVWPSREVQIELDDPQHYAWRSKELSPTMANHIVRHGPAQVLREIEAKRQLVKLHGRAILRAGGGAQHFDTTTVCRTCEPNHQFREPAWPCTTLRLLALPYTDRLGYREEWRP
jgi:hypothetical protein